MVSQKTNGIASNGNNDAPSSSTAATKQLPSYLPAVWQDDTTMAGLMAMTKLRHVNPIDYDRKVAFWANLIGASCIGERNALFTVDTLKKRFRRGDQIPACLDTVLDYARSLKDVESVSEWKARQSGWLGWGLAKTSKWLWGAQTSNPDDTRYVHLPTIKEQSERVLAIYRNELKEKAEFDGAGVLPYDELFERCKRDVVNTAENFDMVLEELQHRGEVTIGLSRNGEKILKFKEHGTNEPVRFTEVDANAHELRRMMVRLEGEIEKAEARIKKHKEEALALNKKGDKSRAANAMRQMKRAQKDADDKSTQLRNLMGMLDQLTASKTQRIVLETYRTGVTTMKSAMDRHGLSPEKVDQVMDDVSASMEDYNDINEALATSVRSRSSVDDGDLEKELEALVEQKKKEDEDVRPIGDLPTPPRNRLGLLREDDDHESLEKRWQRLRALAN